jgi:hypothetical protein
MTEAASRTVDLQLRMSTERGSMARLFESFDAAGVELVVLFGVEDCPDTDHFFVADADAAAAAATSAGATEVGRREVLVAATGSQRDVTALLRGLASNGVGIDMIATLSDGRVVVGIEGDDLERAIELASIDLRTKGNGM